MTFHPTVIIKSNNRQSQLLNYLDVAPYTTKFVEQQRSSILKD